MSNFSKKRIAVIFTGLLSLIMAVLIIGFGLFFIKPADNEGEERVIIVPDGVTLKEVSATLEERGVITNKTAFMLWTRLMGYGRKIKAGEYLLSPSMPPIRIVEILTRGIIITHSVTFPEGFSADQTGDMLAENGLVNKALFISLVNDRDIAEKHGITSPSLEGYLYPDTYQFGKGLSAESIIEVMISRFMEVIEPYRQSIEESGFSMEEVITLASIVEKETGRAEERPIIASVFLNRIKRGMRLESDPTVIYGIKDFSGNLTKKDLSDPTPYNTYVIRGLPPGPIANPGLESIRAVLYPEETDYLYFVSRNDGTHQFSKSLEQHNEAVNVYQKANSRNR